MKQYTSILIENRANLRIIKFNNPKRKNAFDKHSYTEIPDALKDAENDESVSMVALTGVGDSYSSGNDIKATVEILFSSVNIDIGEKVEESNKKLKHFVSTFYSFKKPLIAVINGPCIGIAATTAALCDVLYASESAYFYTPFTLLGLCPEGCSSYTFPKIFGPSKATEMLMFNHKLSAQEAYQYKFVAELFGSGEIETKVWQKLENLSKLPRTSLQSAKMLTNKFELERLEEANSAEIAELCNRWKSDEAMNAAKEFSCNETFIILPKNVKKIIRKAVTEPKNDLFDAIHDTKKMKQYKSILIENRANLRIIKFNNPKIKNAFDKVSYIEIPDALKDAENDESVSIVALTGMGDSYSSGNDIKARVESLFSSDGNEERLQESNKMIKQFVSTFYLFKKPLIAVVNGLCIGIAATTAALCDVVYASESAYFYTPFSLLGLCPEGCSSYTFPKIFGPSKATEMLMFNHKLSAQEAYQYKFVAELFGSNEIETKVWQKLEILSKLPKTSLQSAKMLTKKFELHRLEEANAAETTELYNRWKSDEAINAAKEFVSRKKSKL